VKRFLKIIGWSVYTILGTPLFAFGFTLGLIIRPFVIGAQAGYFILQSNDDEVQQLLDLIQEYQEEHDEEDETEPN